MRKVLILGGVTFATLLLTYVVWIQFPKVTDPEYLQRTKLEGLNSFATSQRDATDPNKNGYLQPELAPGWGREGRDYQEGTPAVAALNAWIDYSTSHKGQTVDHQSLLANREPGYLKALEGFEQFAPAARTAMRREAFVAPETSLHFDTVLMNYNTLKSWSQGMAALAEARAAAKQFESAADQLGSLYSLCEAMQQKGAMLNELFACAIAVVADTNTLNLLGPSTSLSTESRRALAREIRDSIPSKSRFQHIMATETALGLTMFDNLKAGSGWSPLSDLGVLAYSLRLPGLLSREERIFANTHTRLVKELETTGQLTMTRADVDPSTLDYFTGSAGVLTYILMPNLPQVQTRLKADRSRRVAMATVYSALAFRSEKERYPKDLAELYAYEAPAKDVETLQLSYQLTPGGASLHLPYTDTSKFTEETRAFPNIAKWVKADQDGLTFLL